MARRKQRQGDFDSPWKEALEHFLPHFMAFFYSDIHSDIDWPKGYQSLDKELHQLVRDARLGKGLADKLFKVWLKDGDEAWLLIHIEIQGQPEETFPQRVFRYNIRSFERYNRPVVSLVVLTDEQVGWRPDAFEYGRWNARTRIDFLPVKLLEYRGRESEWQQDANPFAQVVLAHLQALNSRNDPRGRQRYKLQLVKGLYNRGWTAEDVRQLFRLIDWLLDLPPEFQHEFRDEIEKWEEERRMPYVTSIERLAKEEGIAQGIEEGRLVATRESVVAVLEAKFGAAGKRIGAKLSKITDLQQLRELLQSASKAETLAEVRHLLPR
jgi:hypothetical protein